MIGSNLKQMTQHFLEKILIAQTLNRPKTRFCSHPLIHLPSPALWSSINFQVKFSVADLNHFQLAHFMLVSSLTFNFQFSQNQSSQHSP
jgi:hypothetical protein